MMQNDWEKASRNPMSQMSSNISDQEGRAENAETVEGFLNDAPNRVSHTPFRTRRSRKDSG